MEASNPHLRLRLPFIASAYSCTSGANQSPAVYRQSHSEQYQAAGFANSTARVRLPPVLDSKLAEPSVELNSHGDHQRVSTLTKMNCMTNSSPINSVSTDSSCNFSHSTNVNHTNQPDNSIQYEHGTHDASLTQYPQQQAKDQHTREPAQYPGDARQHPSIQRIEQLQQLEQQQQQLNYQQLVQQHSLSQQQQQQLIRYQNQLAQQLVLQQQGEQFPQSLNPVQQQYLLQQRYQQQQQQQQQHQQQVNLQQQISYQQQQQQYLASQSSHDSANPNQLQANQQAFLQQQLAYQQHLLSQQQAASNGPEVKQECLDTQQQALLQQIAFQQQNIKTEVNGQQVKQDHGGSISQQQQQHQTAVQQQTTYQHPKSVEQGNQILKQESFGQQNLHPSLQQHVSYHPQVLVQQNLKADPTSTEQQQRNSESNDSPIPNQLVQQIAFKPDHTTQLNKEIAVQNQLILQQQLAYQHQLLAQQQQNSGKRENINPVFFQNAPESSKAESSGALTPQQSFLQQQLAYEQQLIAQQQNLKSELSSETHFPKQNTHSLKQETIDPVLSNQQTLLQQQIEYQQQVLHQQTAVKSEPNEVSQKYPKESVEQNSQHQQASYPQQPDSASGKQDALVSLSVQQNLRQQPGSLPAQLGPQHQFPQLSLPRDVSQVSQLLPGGQLIGSDSQRALKVDSTHPLLPGQVVLPVGQKITHPSRSVLSSASVGSVSGGSEVEFSQSCVPPPLSAIRVVPSGKVLKESNPGPAVQSDHSEGKASIRVPLQWKRLIANSMVIYVSPSNTALSSMDQLKAYLQTQGTCKCGLECPLQCDSVFSFDAKVASKPWSPVELQESTPGEFNKLCNHKRKHMTMMGLEPDTLLDGKRPDGPDFRKKRKVYGGPYSNAAGPRKPRMMPKDASPAPVGQTPWNDPSIQQPAAAPLNPPPAIPPPSPPSGPRLPMPPPQPQASFMQPAAAHMEQQPRLFRYQPAAQRVYPGTPPLMSGAEGMYASNAYAKPPNPSPGEDSQNQHLPTPQSLPHSHSMLSQHASQNSVQMTPSQQEAMELQPGGLGQQMQQQNQMLQQNAQMQQQNSQMQQQGQQMQAQNPQMQAQNQQMHMAQMQAMQQQAQMQAVQAQLAQQMQHQQQQQQQAAQQQQMHLSGGVPTSQQQMISDQTHNVPMQTQQSLPQQQMPNGQMSQVQMKQLNQQSSQQHQMQMQHMQMQAQLAQMQQMQQEYERQNHQQSSHQPSDQYQPEPSNQVPTESANYGKFPGPVPHQASTIQDPKLMLPQQQYRHTAYPTRASYESFPPHSAPSTYPPESSGSYESINCDTIYQNNTNQSVSGTPGVPVNTYLPQPVFNYQRQTPEQLPPPTQRPTPPWQQSSRPPTPSNPTPPSPYERVPPLHPSNVQNTISATYQPVQPEASVPVSKKRTKTVTKSPTSKKLSTDATRQDATPTYPSFMDDPSGYLAQQTALLNSTISKQCDIRVTGDMLENKNLQRLARRHHASTPDSSVRNETSETPVERIKTQHADLKGPIQGGTVSTSHRSPGGILVAVEAGSPRSSNSSPGPKSPERARSMPVASGHTVSSNTLTSVLAGRSNTSLTPSLPSPPQPEVHLPASLPAKSPLEMVQSVVSSIQLPGAAQPGKGPSVSLADIKVSTSLPSHILVSSNGQLIVASQPQSLKSSPSLVSSASSSSSLMTNVTGTLPSLGLGQPTVLVNTLQAPLLFQPNIMTMDNLSTMQIPQLTVSSPVGSDSSGAYSPRSQGMISPESAKRKALKANKQRKVSPQKVTSMLLTPQQGASTGASVVMQPQQSFAQPMLQTLILPNKGNFNNQLITTALQPLNLVQQFPTIQQFLVPAGLGGMAVMSQDGTATLLQDTVQLNVLTPMQASGMFGGQSILTSPNNMVIRSPNAGGTVRPNTSAAQGQFITTNAQNQLIVNNPFAGQLQGQLSPIITNLSPNNQQLSFTSPTSQRQGQEYIQCGQTLIPISSHQSNNASPGSSLTHNSLVQQQMSLLQQANQEQTSQNFIINETGSKTPNFIINDASSKTQNFIITTSDKQPGGTNYILSPKSDTKSPGGQTHFIINTSDSKSSGQSFIITSPTDSKQLLTSGNFILTSDKSNSGNLILSTAPRQHIQQQEKVKLLQQSQQQQIQQITQQQLQQLQQSSQQLQQLQQSQQLQTQQLQQTQQIQQTQQLQQVQQQLQQAQQIQLQNHRLNMSTQTSLQPTSSAHQMVQAPPITIYVSQSQSSSTTNLYTSSSPAPALPCVSSSTSTSSVYTTSTASSVYTASPPDTTTLSPVEAGVPSPCHSLEVPPSPLLADDNQPSPTSTSVHLVSSSNTDWSDGTPDSEGFATPKASSSRLPATSSAAYVKSTSKDCVESSSSPPTHRSYSRHHHSHHHRSHSHHHHPSSKHHHSKPSREHHSEYQSHRSDPPSSRHLSHHVTNLRPDEGSDSDHSNDSSDDSNSALASTTAKLLGLAEGDLVWGQVKGYPSWPGKLISPAPTQGRVWVKWFGMSNEPLSEVEPNTLKSLSQGLEAHHRSRKKLRKSRKLNTQLENAIQEAMAELDRMSETPQQSRPLPPAVVASGKSKR